MHRLRPLRSATGILVLLSSAQVLHAQARDDKSTGRIVGRVIDGDRDAAEAQAVTQTPTDTVGVSLSGVLFLSYQYPFRPRGAANRFDVGRAYLTVAGPIADRLSARLTTDVYQVERDTLDRSWQVRAKYAYFQYDYSRSGSFPAWVRLGMLQTVFIDQDESFWPRWISTVATDRHGFFSSADVGASTRIGLPRRSGEIYATITNGPGFASRETDRFKDYALRLSLTPFSRQLSNPLRTLVISGWGYKGALASRFVNGGTDQVGPVGEALRRDRWGVFAAVAHPRLTASVQYARRSDAGEAGANTAADPRVVTDSSGSIVSSYVIARPFGGAAERLSLIGRWDRVDRNVAVGRVHDLYIAGAAWTVGPRFSIALDFQGSYPRAMSATPSERALFVHTQTRF